MILSFNIRIINNIFLTAVIVMFVGVSYWYFSSYQPKSLRELPEIKGIRDSIPTYVPYPTDSQIIGVNETSDGFQTTFQTSRSMGELSAFYTNIAKIKKWELEKTFTEAAGMTNEYKTDELFIRISVIMPDNQDINTSYVTITTLNRD